MTTGFPQIPLGIKVEILVNGTWVDISQYVYQRDDITITGGAQDQGQKASPAQLTLTLNNRDGRFSPLYSGGAYFPFLKRDTEIRVSVDSQSATGNVYSGFRFSGEVTTWPPRSDPSGTDIYVQVTANGPLRKLRTGGGPGSALTRYYNTLTGSFAPIAYWPCEEDPDTTIIGAGIDGGTDMNVTSGTPKWKAVKVGDFNGSAPIGMLNGSTWDGLTGSFGAGGDDIFATPGTFQWVASTTTVNCKVWGSGGGGGGFGAGSGGGSGAGGSEFAQETSLAVTPGNMYTVTVAAGGTGGTGSGDGSAGAASSFPGDSVTVTAHGGSGSNGLSGGAGGTGSSNTTHHDGGQGASGGTGVGGSIFGGGGGGSGGTGAAGNFTTTTRVQAGASAVTGGGPGGSGGGNDAAGSSPASGAGGGGGGAGSGPDHHSGAAGAAGKVELVYTPPSVPNNNVIRFMALVPSWGGGSGTRILVQTLTSGTVAKLNVNYVNGGKLQLKGFDSGGSTLFDSGAQAWNVDGTAIMVSAELVKSGANVGWTFKAIKPGAASLIGSTSGTVTTATMGNVTECIVAPSGNITKTAMGHISVQYALIDLVRVSRALNGHHTEMGIDRFIRLCNEQALDNEPQYAETSDHWGFETGTQSWTATNGAVASVTTGVAGTQPQGEIDNQVNVWAWPSDGTHSLKLTANGGGAPFANSPSGTSGQPVVGSAGDIVSIAVDIYTPAAANQVYAGIKFFDSGGSALTEIDSADANFSAGQVQTIKVTGPAPSTAAFFNVRFGSHATLANNTLVYGDNVRVHARMGPQTRKEYHKFLEEIEELDRGILKEAKEIHGLKYRTRISLINQTPAVTLDYSAAELAGELSPVVDDQKTVDHVTVHRHRGTKVTLADLTVPVPAHKKRYRVVAERDEQLLALAQHLLNLGTVTDERYPVITVDLARSQVASLFSALGAVEVGDFVEIANLPFFFPSATAKQLVLGYSETLNAFKWEIAWNCVPESAYELSATSVRRW